MYKEPLISVIVYINEKAQNIEKCLKTLSLQTYKNLEIICINNNSILEFSKILEKFKNQDNRIIVNNIEKTDTATARNLGINIAKGEYISFVNACDWVLLDLYQVFVNKLCSIDADIYMFNASLSSPKFIDLPDYEFFDQEDINNNEENVIHTYKDIQGILIKNNTVINKIYKKSFLDKNNIRFWDGKNFSEFLFNIQTLLKANQMIINHEVYYRYTENLMAEYSKPNGIFDIFDIVNGMLQVIKVENIFYYYQVEFLNFMYHTFQSYYKLCSEDLKRTYYEKMKTNYMDYINRMTPDAREHVMGIKEVIFILNSSFEDFNKI